jgi:hypothetical protein
MGSSVVSLASWACTPSSPRYRFTWVAKEPQHPQYDLIATILRDVPALPDALCRKFPGSHDDDDPMLTEIALAQCRSCPCLLRRQEWVESMSRREHRALVGVWAGGCSKTEQLPPDTGRIGIMVQRNILR